jgi:hypothetical protein
LALASLTFVKNLVSAADRDRVCVAIPVGTRPIDWLTENYPNGCGGVVWHWHNGEQIAAPVYDCDKSSPTYGAELEPGDPDYLWRPAAEGDVIALGVNPGLPAAVLLPLLIQAVIVAVVTAAITIAFSLIFKDSTAPDGVTPAKTHESNPAYNVRSRQNSARLGEPVPVVYGEVLTVPDMIAQPYGWFDGARGNAIDMLLCLGHGSFQINEILVGETESDYIEGGGVQTMVFDPNVHGSTFGNISNLLAAAGWDPPYYENVWTSAEVGEQRFTNATEESGWYRVGQAGVSIGSRIIVNIEWPRGLYQMADWGDPVGTAVDFSVFVREVDGDGNPFGPETQFYRTISGASMDPRRETHNCDMDHAGAWQVKLFRSTQRYPNGNEMNEYFWRGLMLVIEHPSGAPVYGNVTLLAVRLNAGQVASSADRLIRVHMTRMLPDYALGLGGVATTDPGNAFIDIYSNQVYGARRPLAELDLNRIRDLQNYWGRGPYQFNAVYTAKTTVWDALAQSVQGVAGVPLPIGSSMSIAQDGPRPIRSMMFSEQNIVQKSFSLSYQFEQTGQADGVEIEYVDPLTFAPAYVRWPSSSLSPERANLFGCSNADHAAQFARLQWQRKQKLRRLVEFQTELEGLIPQPAERIAVAHTLPRWGVSGFVAQVSDDGLTLELDRVLPWENFAGPYYMMFRDENGAASAMVQVSQGFNGPHWVVLQSNPWPSEGYWRVGARQEGTHWVWGDGARVVKDFTLATIAPKGGAIVGLTGVVYDPTVYDGTLAFLVNPVP